MAVQLYRESGIAGFWKGLAPALVMVLNPTLQYILYEWLCSRLRDLRRSAAAAAASSGLRTPAAAAASRLSPGDVFALTALAKLGATLVTYPLLLVKSRLQAMNRSTDKDAQYKGVQDAVARILSNEGFSGFFKGIQVGRDSSLSQPRTEGWKGRIWEGVVVEGLGPEDRSTDKRLAGLSTSRRLGQSV